MTIRILVGDCREQMPAAGPFDLIVADPPYGDTSLSWDRRVEGWLPLAAASLKMSGSIWLFGSMRFFMTIGDDIKSAGLRYAQDIVWEKHNGSGFQADRFKRVHEHVVQFYRDDAPWAGVFNEVQFTNDATPRAMRRKKRSPHLGHIDASSYESVDGGPRMMRSVLQVRSMHGQAIHPTEKPVDLLKVIVRASCPVGGLVGDWFAGSGACGEAAAECGMRYVGCEIDADMAAKAQARLANNLFSASCDLERNCPA